MKPLIPALLLALCAATPARAQIVDDPDIDVSSAVLTQVPHAIRAFDADWTANRLLATAFVETHSKSDRLVVATYDPATGKLERLMHFEAYPWEFEEVSLAVPPLWLPQQGRNRIYVAFTASYDPSLSGAKSAIQTVRMLSVDIETGKWSLAIPPGVPLLPVHPQATVGWHAHPQVCVLAEGEEYTVELAFLDPNIDAPPASQQILYTRSSDYGATLEPAIYLTGDKAAFAPKGAAGIPANRYTRLAIAADETSGLTLFALEDIDANIVRVASKSPGDPYLLEVATTAPDILREHSPRMDCHEGRFNVTCLRQALGSSKAQLTWFTGSVVAGMTEQDPLSDAAATEGDIEVRGNKAYIVARVYPDQGGDPVVTVYEANRTGKLGFNFWEVDDAGSSKGNPRSAAVPEGKLAPGSGKYKSQVWLRPGSPGVIQLDL